MITNGEDAKQIADDYQNEFESLAPLRAAQKLAATTQAQTTPLR